MSAKVWADDEYMDSLETNVQRSALSDNFLTETITLNEPTINFDDYVSKKQTRDYEGKNLTGWSMVYSYKDDCWAAACATIHSYYNGTRYTAQNIDLAIHSHSSSALCPGGTINDVVNGLKYNNSGIRCSERYDYLTYADVKTEINAGRMPYIHGEKSAGGHDMVIYGYGQRTSSSSTRFYAFCDSDYGVGGIIVTTSPISTIGFTHRGYYFNLMATTRK